MAELIGVAKVIGSILAFAVIGIPLLRDGLFNTYATLFFDGPFVPTMLVTSLFLTIIGAMIMFYSAQYVYRYWQTANRESV